MPDLRVEKRPTHSRPITIYDRYGTLGSMSLTEEEAKLVRDGLEAVLEDG